MRGNPAGSRPCAAISSKRCTEPLRNGELSAGLPITPSMKRRDTPQIIGRLVGRGLHDELTEEAYVIIDGVDGRAHHVRFSDVSSLEHAPPPGGIVELRRVQLQADEPPRVLLATRSDLTIAAQVTAGEQLGSITNSSRGSEPRWQVRVRR